MVSGNIQGKLSRFFGVQTLRGEPVRVGNREIVPVARVMRIGGGVRQGQGGWTRAWPVAIEVQMPNGLISLPVRDLTARRLWQFTVLGLSVAVGSILVTWIFEQSNVKRDA